MLLAPGNGGKKIDLISNRKAEGDLHLHNHFAEELNDYFAKVCFDDSYTLHQILFT